MAPSCCPAALSAGVCVSVSECVSGRGRRQGRSLASVGEDGPSVDCQGHLFIHALRKSTQLCAPHSTSHQRQRKTHTQKSLNRMLAGPHPRIFRVIQSSLRRPSEQFPAGGFYLQLHYPEGFAEIIMARSLAPGVGCAF